MSKFKKSTSQHMGKYDINFEEGVLSNFGQYSFYPNFKDNEELTEEKIKEKAMEIYEWARSKGVEHFSFISYPHTGGISEKHDSFIDIKHFIDQVGVKEKIESIFNHEILLKGQTDGSSFPNGGIRSTHQARAYNIWDSQSFLFIRKNRNCLYVPSLLVTHNGSALDDKTLFRECEKVMKKNCVSLLGKLGVACEGAILNLGLEQQFFVIPKDDYLKRPDIRATGRALVGKLPSKNQQFSNHYYGKIPQSILLAMKEVELELLQIGIPFKTKHNEVGNNQFEFAAIYQDAGKSIDHNMITMDILKDVFNKHNFEVLLHEKPFIGLNGSGKHANWSLNYINDQGKVKNLFKPPLAQQKEDTKLFKLFILINLMGILRNNKLYLASIAGHGNEVRLGGHQAPPRIISVFLGQTIESILDGRELPQKLNLREKMNYLNFDINQEDTDRNRTSPYAYTGNKFEFRALGSSQNPSFPMAVIAATMAKEMKIVEQRLDKGETVDAIIADLTEKTKPVRFMGNGYSKEWVDQAKKRGLYVNEEFFENYAHLGEIQKLFVEIGACDEEQIASRTEIVQSNYNLTVQCELNSLLDICQKTIIPNAFNFYNTIDKDYKSEHMNLYSKKFKETFQKALIEFQMLDNYRKQQNMSLAKYGQLRKKIISACDVISELISKLPKDKEFPDWEDFLQL